MNKASSAEYLRTRAQWIKLLQELLSSRDDSVQDELFKDAQILFDHMRATPS